MDMVLSEFWIRLDKAMMVAGEICSTHCHFDLIHFLFYSTSGGRSRCIEACCIFTGAWWDGVYMKKSWNCTYLGVEGRSRIFNVAPLCPHLAAFSLCTSVSVNSIRIPNLLTWQARGKLFISLPSPPYSYPDRDRTTSPTCITCNGPRSLGPAYSRHPYPFLLE